MAIKRKHSDAEDDGDYVFEEEYDEEEDSNVNVTQEEEEEQSPTKKRRINDKKKNKKQRARRHIFTDEEEEKLKQAVIKYRREDGTIDWKRAARDVNPKLHYKQVFQHYKRVTLARRNHLWTHEQDLELLHYVLVKGSATQMAEISKEFYDGHFPDNQLRHHYENHVKDKKKLRKEYDQMDPKEIQTICERNVAIRSTWNRAATAPTGNTSVVTIKDMDQQMTSEEKKYNTRQRKQPVQLSQSPTDEEEDDDNNKISGKLRRHHVHYEVKRQRTSTSTMREALVLEEEPITPSRFTIQQQPAECLFSLLLEAASKEYAHREPIGDCSH